MRYVNFIHSNNTYHYTGSSDAGMDVLGSFFISDISWNGISFVRDWMLNPQYTEAETNITTLEKQGDYIILKDLFPQNEYEPGSCTITKLQFFQLLHDWEKSYGNTPKEISFIYENNQFIMRTKD